MMAEHTMYKNYKIGKELLLINQQLKPICKMNCNSILWFGLSNLILSYNQ